MSILLARDITSGNGRVQISQLDPSIDATIAITNDNAITNDVEATYTSNNLVIKYKTDTTLNQLAAAINSDVSADFSAWAVENGSNTIPALAQTDFEDYMLVPHDQTEADLSSLANVHTVTRTVDNSNIVTYETYTRMTVEGTLFHDPENEVLIIRNSTNGTSPYQQSLRVNMSSNFFGGSNNWKSPTSWDTDSESRFVIELSNGQDKRGHTYAVGDAIELRGNSTLSGGTQAQRDYLDTIYRHCHRVMAVNGDFITLSLKNPYDGVVTVTGGDTIRRPCYNYGREETVDGRTRYSSGCGFISTGGSQTQHHPAEAAIANESDGLLYFRGGTIMMNRAANLAKNVDIDSTTFVGTRPGTQIRSVNGWLRNTKFVNISLSNYENAYELDVIMENATFIGVRRSTNIYESTLPNLDVSTNTADTDIGADNADDAGHVVTQVINSANGSNIRHMWRTTDGRNSGNQKGVCIVKKQVSMNVKDSSGNPVDGVKMYLQDNPSSAARNGLFVETGEDYATQVPTIARAEYDSGTGGVRYLYADPFTYTATSDASGAIDTLTVTTASQVLEYKGTDSSALTANGGPYPIPSFSNSFWRETDGAAPAYSDWDTDRFGGFYKVDRRSDSNTDADDFTFKFGHYNYALNSSSQQLKGAGELTFDWVLFQDESLTETNKLSADAYTTIDTSAMFYDRAKSYLIDNYQGELQPIVSRVGDTIDAGTANITLSPTASAAFIRDSSNDLTIKTTTFTGNLTTDGTVTIDSGAAVQGTIIDSNNPAGVSTLAFSVLNIIPGTTIQLYNITRDISSDVFLTAIASGTEQNGTLVGDGTTALSGLATSAGLTLDSMADASYVLPLGWTLTTTGVGVDPRVTFSGSYVEGVSGSFTTGDEVRVRATCAASTGAFLPYVNSTITNSSGFSLRVAQQSDTIYNNNGIDGSGSTFDNNTLTLTPDYNNLQIDVNDSDNPGKVTVQQIYAKYAYLITTPDGIHQLFGAITAENSVNYRINTQVTDLKIQNISTSDMIITGARLYRDDDTTVIQTGYVNNNPLSGQAGTLSQDTGLLIQYIQPQVETALTSKGITNNTPDLNAIKANTNLIPGLF